ncbi:hypothetical protein IC608_15855 [Devosia sp. PTR5]|jgi:hypothetical protein|uniref:Uncharacterized protein n=1 Tax=Devosia oryzisoli TaxID=2774138 RepID=A0A927IUI1_9HYPH|nr:hypothetical protein [Devosia oryzisoli]MBD8066947.1 hypothetical protein [Devosia oryzisoli]
MPDTPPESPFKLNRTRIFLLAMGILVVLITMSMMMGGLTSYQSLKEAADAAKEPSAAQMNTN